MKTIARYGVVLGVICVLAAGLLAAVNAITKPLIKFQAEQAEKKMLTEILPSCSRFEAVQSPDAVPIYYRAYDKQDKLAGFAFKSLGRGYSGTIETMAGLTLDGKITAVKILSHTETPGLGNRITEQEFTQQFSGKDILGLDSVLAITGATISSKAVMDSLKLRLQEIHSLINPDFPIGKSAPSDSEGSIGQIRRESGLISEVSQILRAHKKVRLKNPGYPAKRPFGQILLSQNLG